MSWPFRRELAVGSGLSLISPVRLSLFVLAALRLGNYLRLTRRLNAAVYIKVRLEIRVELRKEVSYTLFLAYSL